MPMILARRTVRVRRVRRTVALAPPSAPCPDCGRDVVVLTAPEAAGLVETPGQTLESLVATGVVHTVPTVSGLTWICRDSIFKRVGRIS